MDAVFQQVLLLFGFLPEDQSIRPLGRGHIHDTYLVESMQGTHPPVILQRINTFVFRNVGLLMRNMEIVTAHLAQRNRKAGKDPSLNGIVLLETDEGNSWADLGDNGCWRMFWFLTDQLSFETVSNPGIALEGGRAVGDFQWLLSDLDPELVGHTIPGFHDLRMRQQQFEKALEQAGDERLKNAVEWVGFSKAHLANALEVYDRSLTGNVPVRVTHNDTKLNNILFDRNGKATCLIDLDTVMPGYSWYDFGDALRTAANMAPEDEPDTSKIGFNMAIFSKFAAGYVRSARRFLTDDEISLLYLAPSAFAYMQGLRFLTDYLNGDVYYKTDCEDHNLQRAKAQFTLYEHMNAQKAQMEAAVHKVIND